MKLTDKEIKLYLGHLFVLRCYRPTKLPLGAVIWEDWMEGTIQKLQDELPEPYKWGYE